MSYGTTMSAFTSNLPGKMETLETLVTNESSQCYDFKLNNNIAYWETVIISAAGAFSISGIILNMLVFMSFPNKLVKEVGFLAFLLNIAASDIVVDVCIFPTLMIQISEYVNAPVNLKRLACFVNNGSTAILGEIVGVTSLTYLTIFCLSLYRAPEQAKQTSLKNKNFLIGSSWILALILVVPLSFNLDINADGFCIHKNHKASIVSYIGWFIPLLILMYVLGLLVTRKCNKDKVQQPISLNRCKMIISILIGQGIAYTVFVIPMLVYYALYVVPYHTYGYQYCKLSTNLTTYEAVLTASLIRTILNPILILKTLWSSGCRRSLTRKVNVNATQSKTINSMKNDNIIVMVNSERVDPEESYCTEPLKEKGLQETQF